MVLGRPKKYNDNLRHRSIVIPDGMIAIIEDAMREKGMNFNEYVISGLTSVDKGDLYNTYERMKTLEKSISDNINNNSELIRILNSTKNIKASLFEKIEPDDNVTKFVKLQRDKIKVYRNNNLDLNGMVDLLYSDLEKYLIAKGIYIKKSSMTKLLIKQEILNIKD